MSSATNKHAELLSETRNEHFKPEEGAFSQSCNLATQVSFELPMLDVINEQTLLTSQSSRGLLPAWAAYTEFVCVSVVWLPETNSNFFLSIDIFN